MKALEKNKQKIYYANYVSTAPITDSSGNLTGETSNVYTAPKLLRINTSPASGDVTTQLFSPITDYDRTLVTDDTELDIDEHSVVWIGVEPTAPYNYIVKKIAKSLNVLAIAVKEVTVHD